ncbi:PAS domain S-box protein [Streptomyces coeruleorubidus]|uniref:PAS domain S-box protein n=1 Tax=Streptomyces coeruleorubidus TaxID=116188 RepID=UPI003401C31C
MDVVGDPASGWLQALTGNRLDTSMAVAVTDPDGRVTCWSNGAQRLLGYAAEEMAGRPVTDLLAEGGAKVRGSDTAMADG